MIEIHQGLLANSAISMVTAKREFLLASEETSTVIEFSNVA
jgi:hypothetical protein